MKKKVFLGVADLPNTLFSTTTILNEIHKSSYFEDIEINICHTSDFSFDLKKELSSYCLNLKFIDTGYPKTYFIEYLAQHELWKASQSEDFYALFLHSKGSSKTDKTQQDNAKAWSRIMLHGLVDNAHLCEHHLNRGADLVGSMWYRHFKGNFWWGRSDYLRQLIDPMQMNQSNRFDSEYWCTLPYWWNTTPIAKVKNLFYLKQYKTDNSFLEIEKSSLEKNLFNEITIFIDKRIDSSQKYTIEEFINNSGDFSNFDDVYILEDSIELLPKIKLMLNYDGFVFILNRNNMNQIQKIKYEQIY